MSERPGDREHFGPQLLPDGGVAFHVRAPGAHRIELQLDDGRQLQLDPVGDGRFVARDRASGVGTRYRMRRDGGPWFPDPAARFMPDGVHGPSEVVDLESYAWADAEFAGVAASDVVCYELHVGTFTEEGTFEAARRRLPYLRDLGVNALELMPVADWPGRWNWGYDPAALWAPSRVYGRPRELQRLVDEAHQLGLAVLLDVIYNHLGPDGAYAAAWLPMFTDEHHTPWGRAINLDGPDSGAVRSFLVANALYWLRDYHLDGLRLDATFALIDDSPRHFLAELADAVAQLPGPRRVLVAEDNRNLDRLVRPRGAGGYGLDAIWADDFHHLVRRLTAGDAHSYFADYPASVEALARAIDLGWYYCGEHSRYFGGPRGTDPSGLKPHHFVFCIQNHDQVGNRPGGRRLHHEIEPSLYRAVSALLLFAPEQVLLFMGQEWAAGSPFFYFTDHNEKLGRQVRKGRRAELKQFPGFSGKMADPQDEQTVVRSKLDWSEPERQPHAQVLELYRDLLAMRGGWSGSATTTPHGERDGLVVQRGAHRLAVALRPGTTSLPVSPEATLRWHSEQRAYAADPQPPRLENGRLIFERPGAALLSE